MGTHTHQELRRDPDSDKSMDVPDSVMSQSAFPAVVAGLLKEVENAPGVVAVGCRRGTQWNCANILAKGPQNDNRCRGHAI